MQDLMHVACNYLPYLCLIINLTKLTNNFKELCVCPDRHGIQTIQHMHLIIFCENVSRLGKINLSKCNLILINEMNIDYKLLRLGNIGPCTPISANFISTSQLYY